VVRFSRKTWTGVYIFNVIYNNIVVDNTDLIEFYKKAKLFVRGPVSVYQFFEFSKYGINAARIYMYIRMQEGKLLSQGLLKQKEHTFIKLDNKNLEQIAKVHKSHKWDRLRTLEQNGLIELRHSKGKAPEAKIIVPSFH
jgi:hypothetical protein